MHNKQVTYRREAEANKEYPLGALDGFTLFRFAHMWRDATAGGVEAYLSNLNRYLLQRNRMRILQMYLVTECGPFDVEIEQIGQGELIWIPSLLKSRMEQQTTKVQRFWARLRRRLAPQSLICHDILLSTLANYQPCLAVFHWISEDSRLVINYLNNRHVPFVVVNHFQNSRLTLRCIRRQISDARAIGGVSNVDVPRFVRSRFTDLSDGVDTDFFHPEKAAPLERKITHPLILLPSRITEGKGHLDAIRALVWLAREEISAVLVFAGRMTSPSFLETLKKFIAEEGIQDRVIFTGELDHTELRNWYAASHLVILPSYGEGLPKVLLEAQAMEKPTVAYEVGGVAEAIQHGDSGFLLRKGDIESLAIRLKELLENQDKRCVMGKSGRKFVIERFSLESLVIRHENFYASTV
ncbi:MAG: glycosyltransferase family 4 protein [Syntrophaceae bacterium]